MSGKERGVMQMIWKSFVASFKPRYQRKKLVGEDYYGTKYYETTPINNTSNKKPRRHFEAVNKDDFEQELPAEWEAWLRYRRRDPPTKEELERNYQIAMTKKQNAAELEAKYASTESKVPELPGKKKGQQSFPTYEDYKDDDYEIKRRY